MTPRIRTASAVVASLLCLCVLAACSSKSPPLTLAPDVDLTRYAGRWYVIANIPYFAEKGNVGSYFDITFGPADKLTDVYNAHPKTFAFPQELHPERLRSPRHWQCTLAGEPVLAALPLFT